MNNKAVRIGGASGFWGDSSIGPIQLASAGNLDYLVFDYLAELTMSILAAARMKVPEAGYATDFVTVAMRSVLKQVVAKGIRVISNAGGVNPAACAQALDELARSMGISGLCIAVVEGDDVMPLVESLRGEDVRELQSGKPMPPRLISANAYLGALPIRDALDADAQIVITGRCVDSAITLGVLMHEFKWSADDYDRLAAGSLAGHVIECGCQATGGLHTDWEAVPDWPNIGYPIVECHADGRFVVTKPAGTGGLVNCATVGEQVLYEIGDPANYILPDVICDFRSVAVEQQAPDRVLVCGVRGRAPSATYKVCATYAQGFRASAQLTIIGIDAKAKAARTGEALLARTSAMFKMLGFEPYAATHVELLGTESAYGPLAAIAHPREVVLRVTVDHPQKAALELFAREIAAAGTSWSPGTTGGSGGRAKVSPSIRQFAFLLNKSRLQPRVRIGDHEIFTQLPPEVPQQPIDPLPPQPEAAQCGSETCATLPLVRLAYARSGDKGDISNIGVMARDPRDVPLLRAQLSAERVAQYLAHLVQGSVTRYDLPGLHAMNFVCERALGGGGMASLRNDPLGKGMAQILLGLPIAVPVGHRANN